jgi:hypothetical protein
MGESGGWKSRVGRPHSAIVGRFKMGHVEDHWNSCQRPARRLTSLVRLHVTLAVAEIMYLPFAVMSIFRNLFNAAAQRDRPEKQQLIVPLHPLNKPLVLRSQSWGIIKFRGTSLTRT